MIHNGPKWTISASSKFRLLQMILEPDIGRCANKDAGPKGVDCDISHWLERGAKHSS